MSVKLIIEYTDGEVAEDKFDTLKACLDYIAQALIEKEDYADKITITID